MMLLGSIFEHVPWLLPCPGDPVPFSSHALVCQGADRDGSCESEALPLLSPFNGCCAELAVDMGLSADP